MTYRMNCPLAKRFRQYKVELAGFGP